MQPRFNSDFPSSAPRVRTSVLSVIAILLSIIALAWTTFSNGRSQSAINSNSNSLENVSQNIESMLERCSASVVRIETRGERKTESADELDQYFGSIPIPEVNIGSGVCVDDDGLVLTNYHVVRNAANIEVIIGSERNAGKLVGYDSLTDLALLRVESLVVKSIAWGDSNELKMGTLVWALGSPFGLDGSVSMGVISAIKRQQISDSPFQDFLQVNASINPGNSGGPLINTKGELVGINTAIIGDRYQGVGFSLPSSLAKNVVEQLKRRGTVERGWIGAKLGIVGRERAIRLGIPPNVGALIESVKDTPPKSPAAEAGLMEGDVCITWNNKDVVGPLALSREIAATPIEATVRVEVIRSSSKKVQLDIKVGSRVE